MWGLTRLEEQKLMFYVIAVLVTFLDQAFKWGVRTHMEVGESVVIWNQVLHFTYYQNSGAAGSTFQGYGRLFILPAVLFVGYILYARRKGELRGKFVEAGTAFLSAGAAGNAIDRTIFGRVTDFIEFQPGHGIMNIADLAINIGVLLIFLDFLIGSLRRRKTDPC